MEYDYYILFENYTHGMAMNKLLREHKIPARISPAPRSLQGIVGCGMSILLKEKDIEPALECIKNSNAVYHSIEKLQCQIDPGRDRYC